MLGFGTKQLWPLSLERCARMTACLSRSLPQWPGDELPSVLPEKVKQGAATCNGISETELQCISDQISRVAVSKWDDDRPGSGTGVVGSFSAVLKIPAPDSPGGPSHWNSH